MPPFLPSACSPTSPSYPALLVKVHYYAPLYKGLILTHILQTEMKSKMNAFKEGLQREPAFPNGSPARRAIMGAWKTSHLRPEGAYRHGQSRLTRALGQHGQRQRLNHLGSGALWVFTSAGTHLQQAHGQRGQQTRASGSDHQLSANCRCSMRHPLLRHW